MNSYSGIVIEESRRSEQFSDFTPIPCKGFNILCKAKRYGRWWVLKGLKEPYRQDENYKNLLHKEFDIIISLQHPNIVSAYSMEEIPEMGTCIVMEWIDGITLDNWNGTKTEGESIFLFSAKFCLKKVICLKMKYIQFPKRAFWDTPFRCEG